MGFLTPLRVESVGSNTWELLADLVWEGNQGDRLVKRKGTRTDFASTPSLLQSLFPSTGRWTKPATMHDEACDQLNAYHGHLQKWLTLGRRYGFTEPTPPAFSAVDADNIFELMMAEEGVGWLRRNIGWVGVRWGALGNPARRAGWWSTSPRLFTLTALFAAPIVGVLRWLKA